MLNRATRNALLRVLTVCSPLIEFAVGG